LNLSSKEQLFSKEYNRVEFWGFDGGDISDRCLLLCDAV